MMKQSAGSSVKIFPCPLVTRTVFFLAPRVFLSKMLFAICAICVAPSLAQEQFGQITGLITDSAGATVPEAKVDAVNESTGVIKSTTANAQGSYFITSLIPGTYRIVASRPGFKSITRTG